MTHQLSLHQNNLGLVDANLMTSSLIIAKKFRKRHDNVIQSIKRLDIPDDFNALNFKVVEYQDKKGERRIAYNMTRDGFVILVMGFTGKEAMQWKIQFLNAFNAMEAQLSGKPGQPQLDAPSTKEDRKPLVNLVNTLISCAPLSHRDVWHMIHAHMGGKHADELTLSEVQAAIAFVQSKIDLYSARPVEETSARDIITEQALKGAKAFILRISVEEPTGDKEINIVDRQFKATVYITEEKVPHIINTQINAMLDCHYPNRK